VAQRGGEEERRIGSGKLCIPFDHRHRENRLPEQDLLDRHAVLGQRAGLVGADDSSRAERFDRRQVPDEHMALGHALSGQHQGQRQRRQQTLRHHRDDDADGEDEILPERHADRPADGEESQTDRYHQIGDQPAQPCDLPA
jgi:hypothetical protein